MPDQKPRRPKPERSTPPPAPADLDYEPDADDVPGSPLDDPTPDADVPYVALFAGVAPEDVEAHAEAIRAIGGVS